MTLAVSVLGSISLVVGAIGVLNIMATAVTERSAELGLLRAVGVASRQLILLFLGEVIALAVLRGLCGVMAVVVLVGVLPWVVPSVPLQPDFPTLLLRRRLLA